MNYPFVCPKCGHNEIVSMKMIDYTASGHFCPKCGGELQREVSSLVCGAAIDRTGDFYRKVN